MSSLNSPGLSLRQPRQLGFRPEGDDGTMIVGNASDVTSSSSMVWNLNNSDFDYTNGGWGTADWISPPEGSGYSGSYACSTSSVCPRRSLVATMRLASSCSPSRAAPSKTGETTYRWNEIDVPNRAATRL